MSSKSVRCFTHSKHPKTWKFKDTIGDGSKIPQHTDTIPDHAELLPKSGPYDPLRLAPYARESASIFYACSCCDTAFKCVSAPKHWSSRKHKKYIAKHKKCVVRHAYFYAQREHRKQYFDTGRNPLWGQPASQGNTPKGKRKRFSLDNEDEDTYEDEDYCPNAKRPERPPFPLSTRTKLPRMLQEDQKSPRSSSSDDSDDSDAAEEKTSPSP